MTTIPVLDPVTDINDSDLVMVTNKQGHSYTINGAELEKRNKIIMASNTTVTGAPLKAGRCVRIYFSADITASNGNSTMQINYNGVNYYVKAPKDGSLINFVAHAVGSVYKYVQAYTTLELLFDGNQFVIIGNPVIISNSEYVINADGHVTYSTSYKLRGSIKQEDYPKSNTIVLNNTDEDLLIVFNLNSETLGTTLCPCKAVGISNEFKRIFVTHNGANPLYLVINITSRQSDGSIQCNCSTNYSGKGSFISFYAR